LGRRKLFLLPSFALNEAILIFIIKNKEKIDTSLKPTKDI